MSSTRMRRSRRPGTTMVEMAFIALVCFTFMFAIFEFGRVVMMYQVLTSAARTGLRQAVVTATSYVAPATADAQVRATITNALSGHQFANPTDPVVQIFQSDSSGNNIGQWTQTPFGNNIVVQIDADYSLLFPTFGFIPKTGAATNSVHLSVKCMMRSEAN
jgi:Flp pilus assembly protein TadG